MRLLFLNFSPPVEKARLRYFSELTESLAQAAGKFQFELISMGPMKDFAQWVRRGEWKAFDGILALPDRRSLKEKSHWRKIEAAAKIVYLIVEPPWRPIHYVGVDEKLGCERLIRHLEAGGYRRVGYFGVGNLPFARVRFGHFLDALQKSGLDAIPSIISGFDPKTRAREPGVPDFGMIDQSQREKYIDHEFGNLFSKPPWPDAVFCETDRLAAQFYRRLKERKIPIPEKVGLTGWNDDFVEIEPFGYNVITTARQDYRHMAVESVRLLRELVSGKNFSFERPVLVPPEILIRKTTKKTPGSKTHDRVQFRNEVLRYLLEHLDQGQSPAKLAEHYGVSKKYFLEKYKTAFGRDFRSHLSELRLDHSAKLLAETDFPILTVQLQSGFPTYPNFNRLFRRRFGRSPAEYRMYSRK